MSIGIALASRWLPVGENIKPVAQGMVKACYSAAANTSETLGGTARRVEEIIMPQARI